MKLTYQKDWLNAHGADELGPVWVPRDGVVLGSQARFFFLVPLCCCRPRVMVVGENLVCLLRKPCYYCKWY